MNTCNVWLAGLVLLAILQGCSTTSNTPAPVEDRGISSPGLIPAAPMETAPEPVAEPIPFQSNPAVASLLQQARSAQEEGSYSIAATRLERALRIEPDNAFVWSELASVKISQQQWQQALELAMRSNGLAPGNPVVRARNWRTIGRARRELGDPAGSRAAFEKARSIQSQENDL